jgi:hypothetical protein
LVAPAANGIIDCFFMPVAGVGVVLGGGVALAVRVGADDATGEPPNEKGTVVAPVFAMGGAAVVADETRGARGAGLTGAGAPTVFAPTRRAALSSGNDAVSVVTGGAMALARLRGVTGGGAASVVIGGVTAGAGATSFVATRR